MKNIYFDMTGKIKSIKETEKFKPFSESVSAKGWKSLSLSFNCLSGTNRHQLRIRGGHKEDGTGVIYSFTKGGRDEQGNTIKGESIQIAWKDRNKKEVIEKVAEYKKYVIDLEKPNRRYNLKKLLERVNEEEIGLDELAKVGIKLEEEVSPKELKKLLEDELKKSEARRKEFIAESDFIEYLHKLLESGKVDDCVFDIKGEIRYSEYNGKFYRDIVPTRIYLADKDKEQVAMADYVIYFNKDSVDKESYEETDKYYVNGYVFTYDNNRKKDIPVPVQLVIHANTNDEKKFKQAKFITDRIMATDGDEWKEVGFKVELINGSPKVELTIDMLDEIQREMVELEMVTLEELAKELEVYGTRVEELRIDNLARGYNKGAKDTIYEDESFTIEEVDLDDDDSSTTSSNDDVDDSEDDDDLPFELDDLDMDLDI